MVKTVQTIVHRLKDEETYEDSGKDLKPHEDQQVVNNDVGVKVRKLILNFFFFNLFLEIEQEQGRGEEGGRKNLQQAPRSVRSLTWGSIPRPQDHDLT